MTFHIPKEILPVLAGKVGLVTGIANEHSIAYGCACAFRAGGASLALTYLNEKAKPFVEPLARDLGAELFLPLEVRDPAQMTAVFDAIRARVVLSMAAVAPALGGSVTRPGDTIGLAVGVPLPQGVYLGNNTTEECRYTSPKKICFLVNTPIFVWSTPWTIFGGRLEPTFGPLVPIKFNSGANGASGLFNSFGAAQLIWDLGNNWGFTYMLGGYTNNRGSSVAFSSASLNQRFGLSYTGNGWDLTANIIWGIQFDNVTSKPQISPCPVSAAYPRNGCNPNFLNVDLTSTKRFGSWELGPVGTYSTDLNAPIAAYQKQSQFALGGLVGYYFDQVIVQAYVTSDVYANNYGSSRNISGNLRITIPLWRPTDGPRPPPTPISQ